MAKTKKQKPILVSGKRKKAIARVRILEDEKNPGIRINGIAVHAFSNEIARVRIKEPITLIGEIYKENLNIKIRVHGGGWMSQADAIRSGIARGLNKYYNNVEVSTIYNEFDKTLISGDVRRRETKKAGGKGARSRYQKSYR